MAFVPDTEADDSDMLAAIGAEPVERLFEDLSAELRADFTSPLPTASTEVELAALVQARSQRDGVPLCFLGAGAYQHYVPAVATELARHGECAADAVPCWAQSSEGKLQLAYELQSMLAALTAMDAATAGLACGATALVEAVCMAARIKGGSKPHRALAAYNILGGYPLRREYPELGNALLVCATEIHTQRDFTAYDNKLQRVISMRTQAACPVKPKT